MSEMLEKADPTTEMVLKLTGEFRPKFINAACDGYKTGELACQLALAAILAERERCAGLASQLENIEVTDEFNMGWSAAGLEMRGGILGWEKVMEDEE